MPTRRYAHSHREINGLFLRMSDGVQAVRRALTRETVGLDSAASALSANARPLSSRCSNSGITVRPNPLGASESDGMADPYLDGVYRWWHLTQSSPELLAAEADGWLDGAPARAGRPAVSGGASHRVLDVGCGLGSELAYLSGAGWSGVGIDLSWTAITQARQLHPADSDGCLFARADVLSLPFAAGSFALAIDRGCFHYLQPDRWPRYAAEVHRVLRPGGRLLLRACLSSAGIRNEVTESGVLAAFTGWRCAGVCEGGLVSDTREMPGLIVRLERGAGH
jgi:SAM-dependent methyltransferase